MKKSRSYKNDKRDKEEKRKGMEMVDARTMFSIISRRRVPLVSLSRINWKSSISPRLKPPRSPQLFLWFKVAIDQRTFPRGRLRKPETLSLRHPVSVRFLPALLSFSRGRTRNFNQLGRLNLRAPNSGPYFHARNHSFLV